VDDTVVALAEAGRAGAVAAEAAPAHRRGQAVGEEVGDLLVVAQVEVAGEAGRRGAPAVRGVVGADPGGRPGEVGERRHDAGLVVVLAVVVVMTMDGWMGGGCDDVVEWAERSSKRRRES
jgi:hypothetical protein